MDYLKKFLIAFFLSVILIDSDLKLLSTGVLEEFKYIVKEKKISR